MTRPVTLLLVRGKDVALEDVAALRKSRRVHVLDLEDVRGIGSAPAFAARSAQATIVATQRDPLAELVYARTSGFTGPLILAVEERYLELRDSLVAAGVLECVALPIAVAELERLLDVVEAVPESSMSHAPLELLLDAVERTARRGRQFVRLSQREFALLHCLVHHASRPVATSEILEYVWGARRSVKGTRELVDVNISQLRKKLKRIGLRDAITTYRGFGYGLRSEHPSA